MSKCIVCKKEGDGIVCKHCLTKNSGIAGDVIKKGGKLALAVVAVVPSVLLYVTTKGKIKPKISK